MYARQSLNLQFARYFIALFFQNFPNLTDRQFEVLASARHHWRSLIYHLADFSTSELRLARVFGVYEEFRRFYELDD